MKWIHQFLSKKIVGHTIIAQYHARLGCYVYTLYKNGDNGLDKIEDSPKFMRMKYWEKKYKTSTIYLSEIVK